MRRLLERKGSSLNALRSGKAAVKHPSQLHDLMGCAVILRRIVQGVLYVGRRRRNDHYDQCCCCLCRILRCGVAMVGVTSCLCRASLVFYIANDCLSAAIHMDVFDADILVAPTTQASENLYLHRIRFH